MQILSLVKAQTSCCECLVAREYYSGRLERLWLDSVAKPVCPIPMGENSLYVAYYTAEMGCHLTLDFFLTASSIYSATSMFTNGLRYTSKGLLGA